MVYNELKNLIKKSFLYPQHIGNYIRELYFLDFIQKLPKQKIKTILDAGCGNGHYALKIAKSFPNSQVDAIDISSSLFPKKCELNIRFTKSNLLTMNEKGKYDFVYCIDVLEHIKNNELVIKNLYKALKNNGFVFLHIPYDKNNKYILPSFIFKEFDKWAKKEHIGKSYSLEEVSTLLRKIGFIIVNAKYTFGFTGNLAWEIDRATDKLFLLKIVFFPFLKTLSHLSVNVKNRNGNGVAILAQKNINNKF